MVDATHGPMIVWDAFVVACRRSRRRNDDQKVAKWKRPTASEVLWLEYARSARYADAVDLDTSGVSDEVDVRCYPASVISAGRA